MSSGLLSASNVGYYQLHVVHSEQNVSLPQAGTYRFPSSSVREQAIAQVESAYYLAGARHYRSTSALAGARHYKCTPAVNPRREEPVIASGGGLGRLKAALVRVSHAVEAWFHKLLGRDVTLILNLATSRDTCKRTDTGAMGIQDRPLSGPPSVWAENPLYERTTRSISTSTSDLASEKDSDEVFAGETAGDGFDWGTEERKLLAEDDEPQDLSWDSTYQHLQGDGRVEDKRSEDEFNEWIHGGRGLGALGRLDFASMEQADAGPQVTNQQADGNEPNRREIRKRMQQTWA